jgi:hypothetical protein
MPDASGAPAPSSRHAERLARLKILRRKANTEQRKQRRFSKERLRIAEHLVTDIIDGADLIGEGPVETRGWSCASGVYLLVALPQPSFDRLCDVGAELEDREETGDAETEVDEPSLASTASVNQVKWSAGHPFGMQPVDAELDKADDEPSLGALHGWGASDQSAWGASDVSDREHDGDDREPSLGAGPVYPLSAVDQEEVGYRSAKDRAIVEDARRRFAAASGSKVTAAPARDPDGRPGAWLLLHARGGAK